jgi:branched-chain amino acid transport system substrate-binding protein
VVKRTLNQPWALLALAAMAACSLVGCKGPETAGTGGESTAAKPSGDEGHGAARRAPKVEGPEVKGDTILIGLVAAQNGDQKPWGDDSVKGAQLAVDLANSAGGVNGKKIQLLIGDSNSDPVAGKNAAQKLINDGVVGLLGEVASGTTKQIAEVAYDAGAPLIAIGATRTDLAEIGSNFFRVCYTDDFQGPVMAKFAYDDLNLRNVAIMTDAKLPYSVGLSDSFRKAFEAKGGKIVDEQKYQQKETQFSSYISNLKSKNPDGVFLSGYFTEVGPIVSQMRQAGLNVPVFGGDGWDSSELISSGGEAIVGGYFCNHYNSKENRKEVQDFLLAWKQKYGGEPGTTMGALGFDAANLMIDAMKRATSLKAKDIIAAIDATENFPGVSGSITLKGQNGNPSKPALVVKVTRDGFVFEKSYSPEELK